MTKRPISFKPVLWAVATSIFAGLVVLVGVRWLASKVLGLEGGWDLAALAVQTAIFAGIGAVIGLLIAVFDRPPQREELVEEDPFGGAVPQATGESQPPAEDRPSLPQTEEPSPRP